MAIGTNHRTLCGAADKCGLLHANAKKPSPRARNADSGNPKRGTRPIVAGPTNNDERTAVAVQHALIDLAKNARPSAVDYATKHHASNASAVPHRLGRNITRAPEALPDVPDERMQIL